MGHWARDAAGSRPGRTGAGRMRRLAREAPAAPRGRRANRAGEEGPCAAASDGQAGLRRREGEPAPSGGATRPGGGLRRRRSSRDKRSGVGTQRGPAGGICGATPAERGVTSVSPEPGSGRATQVAREVRMAVDGSGSGERGEPRAQPPGPPVAGSYLRWACGASCRWGSPWCSKGAAKEEKCSPSTRCVATTRPPSHAIRAQGLRGGADQGGQRDDR